MKDSQDKKFYEAKARVSGPEDKHVAETSKALARLGPDSSKAMAWILNFAQLDLSALREGDAINMRYDVKAFCCFRPFTSKKPETSLVYLIPDMNADPFLIGKDLPPWDEIREYQQLVQEKLNQTKDGQNVRFDFGRLEMGIFKQTGTAKRGIRPIAEDYPTAFTYNFMQLLAEHAGNVRQCPGCDKDFLASRLNQTYCSSLCQARLAMRLRRNTPQDRIGKRGRPPKLAPTPTVTVHVKSIKGKGIVKHKKSVGKEKSHGKRRR